MVLTEKEGKDLKSADVNSNIPSVAAIYVVTAAEFPSSGKV